MVMDHDTTLHFLKDQFHDLYLDIDDAQEQLHQMQVALHAPPGPMQVDGEEEPQEIQGVSEMDLEEQAPQPLPVETLSSAASEASVNM